VAGDNIQEDIRALAVTFDKTFVNGIQSIVDCPKLASVKIDQSDIDDLADLVRGQE
jgi:hypothetical protein